jgi:hypothetical protein
MASYIQGYRGIGQLLPEGYTQSLMAGSSAIANGISSFGQSVGDAIQKYQQMRQEDEILRGKLEAHAQDKFSKLQGPMAPDADPSKYLSDSPEQQKLWKKFQGGKATHDDLLRLSAYVSTGQEMEERDLRLRAAQIQEKTLQMALEEQQRKEQQRAALSDAINSGYSTPEVTGTVPVQYEESTDTVRGLFDAVQQTANAAKVGSDAMAVRSGSATQEQEANAARYFDISRTAPAAPASAAPSQLTSRTDREGLIRQLPTIARNIAATDLGNYAANLVPFTPQFNNTVTAISGKLFGDGGASNPITDEQVAAYAASIGLPPKDIRVQQRVARMAAQANAPAAQPVQPAPQPAVTLTPKAASEAPQAETRTVTENYEVSRDATNAERYAAALETYRKSGAQMSPEVDAAMRQAFNVSDVSIINKDGLSIVMSGGKPVEVFQQKTGAEDLKPLTAEEVKRLDNIVAAEKDLEDLEKMTDNQLMGPAIGLIRNSNAYDLNAKAINAKINAAVPNLARGVFGEVGVLTDEDIKRYREQLPSLRNTREQRDALINLLRTKLKRAMGDSVSAFARSGRDVRGWLDYVDAASVGQGQSQASGGKTYVRVGGKLVQQ